MPFAAHVSAITTSLHNLRNRRAVLIQVSAITVVLTILHHETDTCLMRIKSREQRSARRTATTHIIKLCETDSVFRKLIEIGSLNSAAVTAQIRKTHVIRHDEQNV